MNKFIKKLNLIKWLNNYWDIKSKKVLKSSKKYDDSVITPMRGYNYD